MNGEPQMLSDKSLVKFVQGSYDLRILFDAKHSSIQTFFYERLGNLYDLSLTLNPLGGDTKIGYNLLVDKNLQMGNSFKMSNLALPNNL